MPDAKVVPPCTNLLSTVVRILGLVPQRLPAEVTTILASSEAAEEYLDDRWDRDLKNGILVKESLDQTETRIGKE